MTDAFDSEAHAEDVAGRHACTVTGTVLLVRLAFLVIGAGGCSRWSRLRRAAPT